MSDPKRATLITVGAPKSEKNKVNKTVRLTINLDESNESKYPELNYKELVIAEEKLRKKKVENGKTDGLNPFSDNDEDVERVARKFEQKYGSYKTTYGRKGRSKHDDFADIGAGYDENDSFIDNTGGYDEMIPPDYDTYYGGFYINCGSLEFKNADGSGVISDGEPEVGRRNKRRLSSSSSDEDSSDSSSDSESAGEKGPETIANGKVDSHKTEHRKKKNKNIDKKKAKKVRRTDSSAATSGKQTSDDNGHVDSGESRTSQSDSLTSKPAPSSENAITSDSSRDIEAKEVKLPAQVVEVLEELEAVVSRQLVDNPNTPNKEMEMKTEQYIVRLERVLQAGACGLPVSRLAWTRASRALATPKNKLLQRARAQQPPQQIPQHQHPPPASVEHATSLPASSTATANKRKQDNDTDDLDISRLTEQEREAKIVETLQRLKVLIDERKPGMMANYNAECERVQEERKKIQLSLAEGAPMVEKRLPKRRFPWCPRSRALLSKLSRLAGSGPTAAAQLLASRALPLFPAGFVRMPTLLRQADLSKEIKVDMKRQRIGSTSQPAMQIAQPMSFMEPIQFPSSLTVTTMKTSPEKSEVTLVNDDKDKYKSSLFGSIINSFSLSKDLVVEKQEDRRKESVIVEKHKDDVYIPPNNIGSITITPVPTSQTKEKKINSTDKQKEGLIRIKSPAVLNAEMVNINKKEKEKALENIHKREKDVHKKPESKHKEKEKRVDSPLHIDTSYQPKQKEPTPSPKSKADEISQKQIEKISKKQIENMRVAENNIPRPALVPVHHSPTFAKPDKRPPEVKKKKEIVIVSDLDPLGDMQQEPLAIDDSSSDVEVVEDNKCEKESEKSDPVPSSDKVSVRENHKKADGVRLGSVSKDRKEERKESLDDTMKDDFDSLMQNIRDLEHSQEAPKFNSNSYGGVITSERTSLNKMDGCSAITGKAPSSTVET